MDGNSAGGMAGGPGPGGAGAGAGASAPSPSSEPGPGSSHGPSPGTAHGPGSGTGAAAGAGTNATAAATSPSSASSSPSSGCGCHSHPAINAITVTVAMTTGGQFTLQVDQLESVDTLKKMASKKLRVPKERICLLYRERQLSGGTLLDHQIVNGSRLTLLPNVETGLLAQRPEQSVMQALESLNDGQVNDFLSGKAPLNLTMRFGDHMMLIQLQLSTVSPQASRSRAASSSASSTSTSSRAVSVSSTAAPSSTSTTTSASTGSSTSPTASVRSMSTARVRRASAVIPGLVPKSSSSPSSPSRSVTGDAASPSMGPPATPSPASPTRPSAAAPTSSSAPSSPTPGSPCSASSPTPEPLVALPSANACEALLSQLMDSATQAVKASASALSGNSVSDTARTNLFRAIDPSYRTSDEVKSDKSGSSPPSSCPSSSSSCPASPKQSSPVTRKVLIRPATFLAESTSTNASTCTSACSTPVHTSRSTSPMPSASASPPPSANSSNTKGVQTCPEESSGTSASGTSTSTCTCEASRCPMAYRQETRVHTRALAEASRNLMQTLKQLSSEVLTNREEEDTAAARRRQGAIIESMHNHGKGVYSGTFSGTLNPALQDRFGRPKRDISTVIHILNDLLCATPQYRRSYQGLPQSNFVLEPNSSSTSSTTPSSGETTDTQSAPPQSSDDAENQATRGKVERLRLVMEERRERRRARREARHSPYGSSQPQHWTAKSETQPAGKSSEAMDTDQPLCDISPPEPVVA